MEQPKYAGDGRWQGYPGWVKKSSVVRVDTVPLDNFVVDRKVTRLFHSADPNSSSIPFSIGTRVLGSNQINNGLRKVVLVTKRWGWIKDQDLRPSKSFLYQEFSRKLIVESSEQLLGDPYYWGGRSAFMPALKNQVSSVDCSGLVSLAYRVAGVEVPRDSKDQYIKSRKIKPMELKMGDLIFSSSKENPESISHVALFVDSETLIEAPRTGENVRKISLEKKYGLPAGQILSGQSEVFKAGDRYLYFGTYFEDK